MHPNMHSQKRSFLALSYRLLEEEPHMQCNARNQSLYTDFLFQIPWILSLNLPRCFSLWLDNKSVKPSFQALIEYISAVRTLQQFSNFGNNLMMVTALGEPKKDQFQLLSKALIFYSQISRVIHQQSQWCEIGIWCVF